ncbi:ABC transporter permease [Nocardioides sp. GXZ039]|uniref:ABC transporter permease n=1 Tax=Nocardioides sp. GXZ039 TaxID=3136018 RepID=UPI0030F40135
MSSESETQERLVGDGAHAGDSGPRFGAVGASGRAVWLQGASGRTAAAVKQYTGVGSVLIALIITLSIISPQFRTSANLINVLDASAVLLVASVGLTFVMLVGGFDLSLGSTMALASVGIWELLRFGFPAWATVVLVLLGSFVLGAAVNGFLVAKVRISFLVVTLGTMSVYQGLAYLSTDGQSIPLYQYTWLTELGSGTFLSVPYIVLIAFGVLLLGIFVLRYVGYGRVIYAIGGNPAAARMAGINITAIRISVWGVAALCAGLAALINTSRLQAATPDSGISIVLLAGSAVLVGGTSFRGGKGTLLGTLFGVLFMAVVQNGIVLVGIASAWQDIIIGVVLILAVLIDRLRNGTGENVDD